MIRRLLARIIINGIALYSAAYFIQGISYEDGFLNLILAAIFFGLINAIVKPILTLLSLPFIFLTLGIFYLVINTFVVYFSFKIIPGFNIDSIFSAFLASILISILNWIFSWLFALKKKEKSKS